MLLAARPMTIPTERTNAFQLQLSVFEGPLDLLLYLIEREELDITAVSLVQVTDQYLAFLHQGEQVDADALAEFVAVGARLLYLKSRALLMAPADDEELEDFGDDLVQRLREYRRFKEAAGTLRAIEEQGLRAYPRLAPATVTLPMGLDGVTLDLLFQIVRDVLERQPEEEHASGFVERQVVTVEEKVAELTAMLERRPRLSFRSFISAARTRIEVIVSFLAVLELIKTLRLRAEQDAAFGDIALVAVQPEPA